jgi:exodeoxyribonuclease V alpha subunit
MLNALRGAEVFCAHEALARGFSSRVARWSELRGATQDAVEALRLAARETCLATAAGHVCSRLADLGGAFGRDVGALRALLRASGLVGTPEAAAGSVLIIDAEDRLYLRRYFDYEDRLAKRLRQAAATARPTVGPQGRALLRALFQGNLAAPDDRPDWQKLATALALEQPITVISGGPGTGKTTAVARILACILADHPQCRIRLAAPTGKAAARMLEALRGAAVQLPEAIQQLLPTESFTVHRLLGALPESTEFRHHANNPLPLDLLVVDEASMLDLALAVKLFAAVPAAARLILLGDKDQLAAVEAGAVFSELSANPGLSDDCVARLSVLAAIPANVIRAATPIASGALTDCVVWLSESYRFARHSGLGRLALHVKAADSGAAIELLRAAEDPALEWLDDETPALASASFERLKEGMQPYLRQMRTDFNDKTALFAALAGFRVLCAEREGLRGVEQVNQRLNRAVREALDPQHDPDDHASPWYPGRVVMVLRNDYVLKLFNGDVGIALPDFEGRLMVYFPGIDGSYRGIAPQRMPEHELAFATTVHKAQGSEFSSVALVLPAKVHRIVTRELLYTAITRARLSVAIVGSEAVLVRAVDTPTERRSGLGARLQDCPRLGR